eukprot:gene312-174_t
MAPKKQVAKRARSPLSSEAGSGPIAITRNSVLWNRLGETLRQPVEWADFDVSNVSSVRLADTKMQRELRALFAAGPKAIVDPFAEHDASDAEVQSVTEMPMPVSNSHLDVMDVIMERLDRMDAKIESRFASLEHSAPAAAIPAPSLPAMGPLETSAAPPAATVVAPVPVQDKVVEAEKLESDVHLEFPLLDIDASLLQYALIDEQQGKITNKYIALHFRLMINLRNIQIHVASIYYTARRDTSLAMTLSEYLDKLTNQNVFVNPKTFKKEPLKRRKNLYSYGKKEAIINLLKFTFKTEKKSIFIWKERSRHKFVEIPLKRRKNLYSYGKKEAVINLLKLGTDSEVLIVITCETRMRIINKFHMGLSGTDGTTNPQEEGISREREKTGKPRKLRSKKYRKLTNRIRPWRRLAPEDQRLPKFEKRNDNTLPLLSTLWHLPRLSNWTSVPQCIQSEPRCSSPKADFNSPLRNRMRWPVDFDLYIFAETFVFCFFLRTWLSLFWSETACVNFQLSESETIVFKGKQQRLKLMRVFAIFNLFAQYREHRGPVRWAANDSVGGRALSCLVEESLESSCMSGDICAVERVGCLEQRTVFSFNSSEHFRIFVRSEGQFALENVNNIFVIGVTSLVVSPDQHPYVNHKLMVAVCSCGLLWIIFDTIAGVKQPFYDAVNRVRRRSRSIPQLGGGRCHPCMGSWAYQGQRVPVMPRLFVLSGSGGVEMYGYTNCFKCPGANRSSDGNMAPKKQVAKRARSPSSSEDGSGPIAITRNSVLWNRVGETLRQKKTDERRCRPPIPNTQPNSSDTFLETREPLHETKTKEKLKITKSGMKTPSEQQMRGDELAPDLPSSAPPSIRGPNARVRSRTLTPERRRGGAAGTWLHPMRGTVTLGTTFFTAPRAAPTPADTGSHTSSRTAERHHTLGPVSATSSARWPTRTVTTTAFPALRVRLHLPGSTPRSSQSWTPEGRGPYAFSEVQEAGIEGILSLSLCHRVVPASLRTIIGCLRCARTGSGSPSSSPFAIRKSIPKRNTSRHKRAVGTDKALRYFTVNHYLTSDSIRLKIKGYVSVNTCPLPPLIISLVPHRYSIQSQPPLGGHSQPRISNTPFDNASEKRSLLKRIIIITRVQVVSGPTFHVLLNVGQSKGTMGKIKSNILIFLEHHTVSPQEIWGCSPRTYLSSSFFFCLSSFGFFIFSRRVVCPSLNSSFSAILFYKSSDLFGILTPLPVAKERHYLSLRGTSNTFFRYIPPLFVSHMVHCNALQNSEKLYSFMLKYTK